MMDEMKTGLFETDHLHQFYIKIREWDDRAKIKNLPLPDLTKYKQLALNHLLLN